MKDGQQIRILDEAARRRRQRKALEALEQDNFSDDPHADLKMSKKAPKFEEVMDSASTSILLIFFTLSFTQTTCRFLSLSRTQ